MLLPIDVIALAVAVGALASRPPVSRWLSLALSAPLVIAIPASFRAISLHWWVAPAAALVLGAIIFSGMQLNGLVKQLVVAASAFVLGLAFGPPLYSSDWPSGAFTLLIVALVVPMILTLWTSMRGGAWAGWTRRLIGSLVVAAGAVFLILGSRG